MKVNRTSSSNMRFLFGSVFFFAVLIFTMVLFVYYAMGEASKQVHSKMFAYTFYLSGDSDGNGCDVLLDDSLLFSSTSVPADTMLVVNRYFTSVTVFEEGKEVVKETAHFTPESEMRVVMHGAADTLAMKVGGNSNIVIMLANGTPRVRMTE